MADEKDQLAGHRAAVREHVEKYKIYPNPADKNFALKTIRNVQAQIAKLIRRHPHWPKSWEDTWVP